MRATNTAPAVKAPAKTKATKQGAAAKTAAKSASKIVNAIELLKEDHKRVKKMFKEFDKRKESASDSDKQALVQQICTELTVHTQIEEEIFYPALRKAIDDEDMLDEAIVEHGTAKDLIKQLQSSAPSDAFYDARVTVLGEYIDHHVEEEEDEMFKRARKAKLDMEKLGKKMASRKRALLKEVQ